MSSNPLGRSRSEKFERHEFRCSKSRAGGAFRRCSGRVKYMDLREEPRTKLISVWYNGSAA